METAPGVAPLPHPRERNELARTDGKDTTSGGIERLEGALADMSVVAAT